MTGNFHVAQSLLQKVLKTQSFSWVQLLLASIYSGAFHPTAEGHAAIADAVVEKARAVLAKYEGRRRAAKTRHSRPGIGRQRSLPASHHSGRYGEASCVYNPRIRAIGLQAPMISTRVHVRLQEMSRLLLFLSADRDHQARPGAAGQAFRLSFRQAKAKFTVERLGSKYSMRRKADRSSAASAPSSIPTSAAAPSTRRGPRCAAAIRAAVAAFTTSWPSSGAPRKTPEFIATTNNT